MPGCCGDHCVVNLLVEVRVLYISSRLWTRESRNCSLVTNDPRKRRAGKTSFDVPGNASQSAAVYEEPDKPVSKQSQQGNYELTQCPAYESTTSKPQPQPTEDQSSHYEM